MARGHPPDDHNRRATRAGDLVKYAAEVWSAGERTEFSDWLGANPTDFLQAEHTIWLPIVDTEAKFDDLPTEFLVELRKGTEDAL